MSLLQQLKQTGVESISARSEYVAIDPDGKKLRIDAAGYQASIIDYCFEHNIEFSIRAFIDLL
jgi:hypothetical protein